MRFETLLALSDHLGKPLGQSYERQQLFAGKIGSGPQAGWDWAPIYLSSQLQDTEFGTLLNIADQELKSWSECARIHYASFNYPVPDEFPFGVSTASAWVFERTFSPSLIFNWNTKGFATATRSPEARVVTASGTAALPVLYIVPDDPKTRAMRRLMQLLEKAKASAAAATKEPEKDALPVDPELAASNTGSGYFARLGDPVLVRVARNVLLYQVLGDGTPFETPAAPHSPPARARSELVTNLLVAEATPWIQEILSKSPNPQAKDDNQESAGLRSAMLKSNLSVPQLAELIAKPELQGQRLSPLKTDIIMEESRLRQIADQAEPLETELRDVEAKAEAEFRRRCRDLSGTISPVPEGLECSYKSSSGLTSTHLPNSYAGRLAVLEAHDTALRSEAEAATGKLKRDYQALQQLFDQVRLAEALGAKLRERTSLSGDLDSVLAKVLQVTATSGSRSSIQTPSVVLSQNVVETQSVGGHNIDGIPWEVEVGRAASMPHIHWVGERPTVVMPLEQSRDSAVVTRTLVTGEAKAPGPGPTLLKSLRLDGPPDSFLERLSRTGDLPGPNEELLGRARVCDCDIYVERMDSNTSAVVRSGPPLAVSTVFGDSALIDDLSRTNLDGSVLFVDFPLERVTAIGEGARRAAGDGRAADNLLEHSIEVAKRLFARGVKSLGQVLQLRTASDLPVTVAAEYPASRTPLLNLLNERPSWNRASVVGRQAADADTVPLVEVRFSEQGRGNLKAMRVFVHDGAGVPVSADGDGAALASREIVASLTSKGTAPDVREAVKQIADRMYRESKDAQSVDIFLDSVDKFALELPPLDSSHVQIASRE
jgi:hypothetical protein